MGVKKMKTRVMIVLLMAVLMFVGRIEQTEGAAFEKWTVHVMNDLTHDQKLLVHCQSKDNNLGEHRVNVGSEYYWSFRINFWETTLFWCQLKKPNGQHASFEAFWVEKHSIWLYYRCLDSACYWHAKDDGIYLANNPDKTQLLIHKWEN